MDQLQLDRKKIFNALLFVVGFLVVCWSIFLINDAFSLHLRQFGNKPRKAIGLIGILTSPLLHGDTNHILNNTLSFFSLGMLLFYFYRKIAPKVFLILYFLAGILLWMIGSGGNHIGASGVIYGLASFLFFGGILNDNTVLTRVSLVVAFLYGSIVWGVLPIDPKVSWEGHLGGLIAGVILAFVFRGKAPKRKPYQYEIDEIIEAKEAEEAAKRATEGYSISEAIDINYTYIPPSSEDGDNEEEKE